MHYVYSRLQEAVLKALTRKMNMSAHVDLGAIAQACPDTYTGADLYAVCAEYVLPFFPLGGGTLTLRPLTRRVGV